MSSWEQLCPVRAYLAIRGYHSGLLFVFRIAGVLPISNSAQLLMVYSVNCKWIHGAINNIHSVRIGMATTARQVSIPDTIIKMLGRWKSDAYQSYIKTPPQELSNLSRYLNS